MARAGIRGMSAKRLAGMTICPRHRHSLGRFWRPPKTCQYPDHTGKVTRLAGRQLINFQMAEEIRLLFGKTAVGSRKYIEDITRWQEDMNFMFEWQEQYLTSERSERVRYCSCHENIKFISSSQRVMFFLLYGD